MLTPRCCRSNGRKCAPVIDLPILISQFIQIVVSIYGFLVGAPFLGPLDSNTDNLSLVHLVFWGAGIVLFLAKMINLHNSNTQAFWVELCQQVETGALTHF